MNATTINVKLNPEQYDVLRATLDRAIDDAPRQLKAGVLSHPQFVPTLAAMRMLREDIFGK